MKPGETPKASVVMTVYNREDFLSSSIEGILNQTLGDFEFVIVDDGSTDNSREIIDSYSRMDSRIYAVTQENAGLCNARNTGINLAKSGLIMFTDDDDISLPDRLESQYRFLKENKDVSSVNCWKSSIDESGEIKKKSVGIRMFSKYKQEMLPDLSSFLNGRGRNFTMGHNTMVRKECIQAIGGFREIFRSMEDVDAALRFEEQYSMGAIPEPLYLQRSHKQSCRLSRNLNAWGFVATALISAHQRRMTGKDPVGTTHTIESSLELFRLLPDSIKSRMKGKLTTDWKRKIYAAVEQDDRESYSDIIAHIEKMLSAGHIDLDTADLSRLQRSLTKASIRSALHGNIKLSIASLLYSRKVNTL